MSLHLNDVSLQSFSRTGCFAVKGKGQLYGLMDI